MSEKKKDMRSRVELFLLKYINWWGPYSFDANDWTTREEIRKMLDEVPGGDVRELFKRVRAKGKSKPRLALFDEVVEEMKRAEKELKRESAFKDCIEDKRAEVLEFKKDRERAGTPPRCKACGQYMTFTIKKKWVCVMCEVQKRRTFNTEGTE